MRRKRTRRFCFFVFFVVVIFASFVALGLSVRPVAQAMAVMNATHFAETLIHDAIGEKLKKSDLTYEEIAHVSTDDTGKINTVRLDVIAVNSLRSDFSESINTALAETDTSELSIPLGSLSGLDLLSGRGPKIPVRLVPVGYAGVDIKSDFVTAGINQTKHTVFIDVTATVKVIAPFSSAETTVSTTVPLAETVIVGNTPDTFADLSALTK